MPLIRRTRGLGRMRQRRECPSCRVQARKDGHRFCPNCGHAYGELAVPERGAEFARPTLVR